MRRAVKVKDALAPAYELGRASDMELALVAAGKIRVRPDGRYELFSLEAVNGTGQIARAGDLFKVDGLGAPYPIERECFLQTHRAVEDDLYHQITGPLCAWTADDEMCPEIEFLMAHKGLRIDEKNEARYFTAPLWGTVESAPRDAVIVFYELCRDEGGEILDATFNFVARCEFERTYRWVG